MKTQVKVEGLVELRKTLRNLGDKELVNQLKQTNKSAAQIVVQAALPNVPVRSGRLKGSVRALGSQRSGRAVAGAARAKHAGAIHWGRKRGNVGSPPGNRIGVNMITGRPFLWNAARAHERQIAEQYADDIAALLRRLGLDT